VADQAAGEAVVVDPGEEWERILGEAGRRSWRITGIWLTHAHVDHIFGVAGVRAATGAPIHLHPADRALYDALPEQARYFGVPAVPPPPPDWDLAPGSSVQVGSIAFEVRHTPGHSPGGVSLVGPGVVLTGDALFAGSIGRTDLPGGDSQRLLSAIRRELLSLPDETIVYSGHGPETTIGEERASNPFLT
jgi:glyoxylase-like metal-dependent hydrolase (beta-lactamase superfamily II)